MVFMDSCDLLRPPGVLTDPTKFAYGSYLIELVDLLTEEAHPVVELYNLLVEGLEGLCGGAATAAFLRAFELRLLHHAGYGPQLQRCAECDRRIDTSDRAYFDPSLGSIGCVTCCARRPALIPISGEALHVLETMRTTGLSEVQSRHLTRPVATETSQLMGYLLTLHLPRPLRSTKLIAALAP